MSGKLRLAEWGSEIMKRYIEYKDSGVDWIGEIPKHWTISKVKHEFESLDNLRIPLNSETRGNMKLKVYDYYGASGVIDKVENYIFDEPLILIGEDGANLSLRSTPLAFKASGKYWVNNHAHILRPKHGNIDYLTNMLESLDYAHYITGAAQPKLTSEHLMNITVITPLPSEQTQIATFLDRKTGKIDELIRVKERKIELLREQRTALINQAVTKGLDPNVEMKPSGVEWIGEIPVHWKFTRNKHIFDEQNDRSVSGNETLLTVSHLTGVSPRADKNVTMFLASNMEGYKRCSVGNLVINTMWAWMGALGISEYDGIVSPSYNVYRLKSNEYLPRYYDYLCQTPNHISEIIRWSKGVWHSRLRLYPDAFFRMSTPAPPVREQSKIADFLDHKTVQIDELISEEQRSIELLKEYRQSLISDAVTGKIDVRSEV